MKAEQYYFKLLNKQQKEAYHAIQQGVVSLQESFAVPKLSAKELTDIFFLLRLDHPEIFWVSGFRYRFFQNADNVEFIPEYQYKKKQIISHRQAMESRVKRICREAISLSELQKEQYIHDFICKNVHYDKLKRPYAHEIIGPMGQGVGVCEGIAKSVKILCDYLNLWCVIAVSDNNPDKGIKYRHTWNIVRISDCYYHLDATFDNTLGNEKSIRYDYFNLSDQQLFRDHEPAIWKLPICDDSGGFWYKEKKLSFTKLDDLYRRVEQTAKKGREFTFHWRGSYLTREMLSEITNRINEIATANNRHVSLFLNWSQAVIRIMFLEKASELLYMQEANESEAIESDEIQMQPT